jgi:hypothetical protein
MFLPHLMRLIAISLLLFVFGCGTSKKVIYAKYGRLKLDAGEINSYPVNGNDVKLFETCCYTGSDQIFLNRAIHEMNGKYDLYISVSEQLLPGQMQQIFLQSANSQLIDSKSELLGKIKVDGYFIKQNNAFSARFVYVESKSGLLIIYDFTSGVEQTSRAVYDQMSTYLNEKIRI